MVSASPEKPILIVGAPGSGTTLLYQTLCSHRDLAYITHIVIRKTSLQPTPSPSDTNRTQVDDFSTRVTRTTSNNLI